MVQRPRSATLFPYTTLFRSIRWVLLSGEYGCVGVGVWVKGRPDPHKHPYTHTLTRAHSTLSSTPHRCWRTPRRFRISDRKSTRLNSSHTVISYAVFCLKKKS